MISENNEKAKMEQIYINESTDNSHELQELNNIQNPPKTKTKGRPPTKRYKSSIEYEKKGSSNMRSGSSSRNTYKCYICGQSGHNVAYHKNNNNKLKEH